MESERQYTKIDREEIKNTCPNMNPKTITLKYTSRSSAGLQQTNLALVWFRLRALRLINSIHEKTRRFPFEITLKSPKFQPTQ